MARLLFDVFSIFSRASKCGGGDPSHFSFWADFE